MKTPIQELIDSVGNMAQGLDAEELYDYFTKKATELLEKERKVKKTVEERTEEEYPLIAAEGFGGANAIIMRQREAYIKGVTDNQEQRVDYQKMFSNCSQPDQLREYTDEEIQEAIKRMNEQPLQVVDTGSDQLREAAEKVVKYCDEWDETPFRLQMVVEELEKELNQNKEDDRD